MAQQDFHGIGVSEGVRIAKAFVYRPVQADCERNIPPDSAQAEADRLKAAAQEAGDAVSRLMERAAGALSEEQLGILKGQKFILADPAYLPAAEKLIRKQNFSAEKAVRRITDQFAALFAGMPNPYMRERATDVRDAGNRLIRLLSGAADTDFSALEGENIVVAEDLSAADTIRLDRRFVLGFATETGGPTSHTAIFAKSMGIPAVVGAPGMLGSIRTGDLLILDGAEGLCIRNPDEAALAQYREKYERERRLRATFEAFSHRQAAIADGRRIVVAANIGSASDTEFCLRCGAEAVGLMRTEALFLSRSAAPTEEEQFAEYKKAAQAFSGSEPGELIIRTLDIGGDKAAPYLGIPKEDNPFLGFRAIRLCFDRRELFTTQLRAILRASAFGKIRIMLPMISGLEEFRKAKQWIAEAKAQLESENIPCDPHIKIGAMIEVPAAALMADALASEADFFSIGTNDLTQYTLAADRGNPSVAYLYDSFNPAVLRLVHMTARAAGAHGIPVGMCGGMAGDPLAIPLLVGLGLGELSMAAGAIAQAKYILSKLEPGACRELAEKTLTLPCARDVRGAAEEFARRYDLL